MFKKIVTTQAHLPGLQIRIDLMRIRIRIWIKHFFLCADPDSGSGFDDLKLKKIYSWKFLFLVSLSTIAIYLSLGLHKGRPSYRRSLQPSKEKIQHFKT
jgi:hypothetical protein